MLQGSEHITRTLHTEPLIECRRADRGCVALYLDGVAIDGYSLLRKRLQSRLVLLFQILGDFQIGALELDVSALMGTC